MDFGRLWIVALVGLLLCGCGGKDKGTGGAAECDDTSTSPSLPLSTVTLFDAHGHLMPSWKDNVLPKALQAGGLSKMVLLGVGDTLSIAEKAPDSFVACAWSDVGDEDLDGLIEQLDAGAKCIGETSIRHFPAGVASAEKAHDATSPYLLSVYQEARKRGVPINVHFDYTEEHISELKAALSQARDDENGATAFIWAHMGDAPASVVRQMLEDHDNLHVDLSSRNPLCSFGSRLLPIDEQRLDDGTLKLKEEWRTLFEDHSDRVLFGTDIGPGSRHTDVARIAEYYRTLLGQLSEEAQERIGHANAEALFGVN